MTDKSMLCCVCAWCRQGRDSEIVGVVNCTLDAFVAASEKGGVEKEYGRVRSGAWAGESPCCSACAVQSRIASPVRVRPAAPKSLFYLLFCHN